MSVWAVIACTIGVIAFLETILPRLWARICAEIRETCQVREAENVGTHPPSTGGESGEARVASVSAPEKKKDSADSGDAFPRAERLSEADRLWLEAREMPHAFIPDPETDGEYLARVYGAAKLGHLEAMVKLGDYVFRRGALVEAYYWTALAELKGADGLGEVLQAIQTQWIVEEGPTEYENAYDEFTEEQGSFARALLRLRCAIDVPNAYARMCELADQGSEEAKRFLENDSWGTPQTRAS